MKPEKFMEIAHVIASQSNCVSYKVGAVIVKMGRIVSHGYNGSSPGTLNCCDKFPNPTYGENGLLIPVERAAHRAWSLRHEVHAESNAIAWAARNGLSTEFADLYVTLSPCLDCCKLIKAAGIQRVYYGADYDQTSNEWIADLNQVGIQTIKIVCQPKTAC